MYINNSFIPVTAALNFKVKKKQLQVTPSCTTTTTFENGIYGPGLLGPLMTHANAAVLLTAVTVYGTVTSPTNAQRLIKRASSLELWDVYVRAKLRDEGRPKTLFTDNT
jgi:hypothetical protein